MNCDSLQIPAGPLAEAGCKECGASPRAATSSEHSLALLLVRRILVPVDFSPDSIRALQYAAALAKQFGARICLLYVGQEYHPLPSRGYVNVSSGEAHVHAFATRVLAKLAAQHVPKGIPVDYIASSGSPAPEIVQVAKGSGADLIVMSTRGYTGLKHAWYGSVAEHVVRRAPCPVLVVRGPGHDWSVETSEPSLGRFLMGEHEEPMGVGTCSGGVKRK